MVESLRPKDLLFNESNRYIASATAPVTMVSETQVSACCGIRRFLFLLGTYGPLVGAFSGQGPGLLDLAGDDADADAE